MNSNFEYFKGKSNLLAREQLLEPVRSLVEKIDWKDRLVGILGARGTGKTTLLLQRLKKHYGVGQEALYLSLDDIYFTANKLVQVAEEFRQYGGKILFLDEVHKYPDWAREIKNLYDQYKELSIVFTGSSITDMIRQNADLSRRSVQYELPGLSYREYLVFTDIAHLPIISLDDLLSRHTEIAASMSMELRPLQYFQEYLRLGYYPFFKENPNTYFIRLEQMTQMIVENDLQFIEGFDPHNTRKIYQLLYILASNVPFKPNISNLSEKTGLHRNTIVQYLHYLEKARLINALSASGNSTSILQKPDKIFLENTNLHYALAPGSVDKGSLRESFFLNQLKNAGHTVSLSKSGDFMVDDKYTFEVGGKGKSNAQVKGVENAFVVVDDIEGGFGNRVPLWIMGMMY